MITRITVENFKALRDVNVELSPFTVLIGPNDSGKSSLLEAIYAISESTRTQLSNCFWSPWQSRELVHKHNANANVGLTVTLAERRQASADHTARPSATYSLKLAFRPGRSCTLVDEWAEMPGVLGATNLTAYLNSGQTSVYGWKHAQGDSGQVQAARFVATCLPTTALTRWDVEELAQPSRLPAERVQPLDVSGYGLPTCIAEVRLGPGGQFDELRKDFCNRFPTFRDIIIHRTNVRGVQRNAQFQKELGSDGEGYALAFVRTDGVEIPAALASGGALVTLAFLTLIHLREPRKLLLIEEPENGLHPGRLREVVQILRSMVSSRDDCQVILTTHSPLLLDHVDPAEVRVFLRNEQDDIEVHDLSRLPDIRERMKFLMLGELVYNEGENELVKEIRDHASAGSGRRSN